MARGQSSPEEQALDRRIGYLIRQRRQELGLSQQALGNEVGISFQQVQKYETGCDRTSASRLCRIAHALQVNAAYFFEEHAPATVCEQTLPRSADAELVLVYRAIRDPRRKKLLIEIARAMRRAEGRAA